MKILSFTGGSTQGGGLYGVGLGIIEDYKPNVIICESVSALFAIPLAMKIDVANVFLSYTTKDIFGKYPPLNKKNNFLSLKGLIRLLTFKKSLGKQDELLNLVQKHISESVFEEYKNGNYADVYIAATNYTKNEIELFNAKELDYQTFLKVVLASCNLPILINGVEIGGCIYYDAGIKRPNAGIEFLKANKEIITNYYSVWNRSEKIDWNYNNRSILEVAAATFKIMLNQLSLDNAEIEKLYCHIYKIKNKQYFFQTELDSLYDVDLSERKKDIENGYILGKNK